MSNNNSGKVEDIFPTWFKKVQVTFSGELPLSQDERQQVFVIPYALFENAIEAYISSKVNEARLADWQEIDAAYHHAMEMDFDVRSTNDMFHLIQDRIRTLKKTKLDQLSKENRL